MSNRKCMWYGILLVLLISLFTVIVVIPMNEVYKDTEMEGLQGGVIKSEPLDYKAGGFLTSNTLKMSWYIIRMYTTSEGVEYICILDKSIPLGGHQAVFENCLSREYILSDVNIMKPYPTNEAKFTYFDEEF